MLGRAEPIPSDKCGLNAITAEDERLYVFALSEDSVVWYKYQKTEGGWSTWRPLADRKKMASGPKPVRHANGTMQVFARGADRQYYFSNMITSSEWSDWAPLGDKTFHSPPAPVVTAAGTVMLFGIAADTHSVWFTESTPMTSDEFAWGAWADLGGDSTSPVAVLHDAESLVHVFIRGTNRALWHLKQAYDHSKGKTWGEWECLGGVLASAPRVPATLNGVNLVEVYARAADKALWHRAQSSSLEAASVDWDAWTSLGGVLASGPAVVLNDDGLGEVFARATDKAVYFKSQIETSSGVVFSTWQSLGGMFSSSPSAVVRADGMIDVFARGIDKAIWHSRQSEVNGTRTFSSWHSLGGHTRKFTC